MRKGQKKTPLADTLLAYAKRRTVSFHTPGHKAGRAIDGRLRDFTGKNVFALDVTVFPEVDSLHDPVGPIREAQKLMARAYGVKHSFFLVNGSTAGNQAMLMAACDPGDSVILTRSIHKSVLAGIILSGVWPIWIQPRVDQTLDIILDASPDQVEEALQKFPEAKAVLITSPTYNGITADLLEIAEICHRSGKLLLVDEAHGPHLRFHRDFPDSGVEAGADLVVQSIHKCLAGLSQASALHVCSDRVDVNRVKWVVSMLQTTSPNYLVLASIDLARRQAVLHGDDLFDDVIEAAEYARRRINRLKNFFCFTREDIRQRGYDLDVTKLTINVTKTGLSGQEVDRILSSEYQIQVDCADIFNLIAILGIGTVRKDVDRLCDALEEIDNKYRGSAKNWTLELPSLTTEMVMTPRDALFAKKVRRIPLGKAAGHISARTLTPYPPGIPVLIPGERISQEVVDYLEDLAERNVRVVGQEAETLRTVKVVDLK